MRKYIGIFFFVCAGIATVVFGLWGLYVNLSIIYNVAGYLGIIIGFLMAPITFIVIPFYALFKLDIWFPMFITFGGTPTVLAFIGIGLWLTKDR